MTDAAQNGNTVRVHYTGKFSDGTVFDTSDGREPLEFTLGEQQLIPGFERAVLGMNVGDTKTVNIPPELGYGPRDERLIINVKKQEIPEGLELHLHDRVQVGLQDGGTLVMTVTDVTDDGVTLDGNHPLAGQDLIFEIELVEIVTEPATD